MHEAYSINVVLEKLPLAIESIACYGNILLIGTKAGTLLVYEVKGGAKFEVKLLDAVKTFSKKPVCQLEAVPELDLLISLTDNQVYVHTLSTIKFLCALGSSKGANVFAIDIQELNTIDGAQHKHLRLSVAVRKKLKIYFWKAGQFIEYNYDLSVPDVPKTVTWCQNSLCVGFKSDYYMVETDSPEVDSERSGTTELFPTGRGLEPVVARVGSEKLALRKDTMSILIDSKGKPTQTYAITWSDAPIAMVYRDPYLIGVLPKFIEIRTIEPKSMIQSLEVDRPKYIAHSRDGVFYVASVSHVWRLLFVPVDHQISELLNMKEFELALLLAETEKTPSNKILNIKSLHAFELFCQGRYDESLKIFAELGTDPSHVIGLYPDMLPKEYREKVPYPRIPPEPSGVELEKALLALIDYLTLKRTELQKMPPVSVQIDAPPLMEGSKTKMTRKNLCQIIDTTLLKCYLEINDALVAPLLRLKDNSCHIEESESVLKRKSKWAELIILYETKGLHRKALAMLLQQSQAPSAPEALKGVKRTIEYLQRLTKDNLPIIFEYAKWVLKADPGNGLLIFIDEMPEIEQLPRKEVLMYLLESGNTKDLVLPYLTHIINVWHETGADFHDQLINSYRELITPLLADYIQSLPEGQQPAPAGKEGGQLGLLRSQLLAFLDQSKYYKAERLMKHFPYDYFYEERAILLGRCGLHKQALSIYINILQQPAQAEAYCQEHYDPDNSNHRDVYLHLLEYYLKPSSVVSAPSSQSNLTAAMLLLQHHASKLDSLKVLMLLPDECKLADLLPFLTHVIELKERQKRQNQVITSLYRSEKMAIDSLRILSERTKFRVTDTYTCQVCGGKISTSSFARYPNGKLIHYGCLPKS